jgi:cell division septation protein DedD
MARPHTFKTPLCQGGDGPRWPRVRTSERAGTVDRVLRWSLTAVSLDRNSTLWTFAVDAWVHTEVHLPISACSSSAALRSGKSWTSVRGSGWTFRTQRSRRRRSGGGEQPSFSSSQQLDRRGWTRHRPRWRQQTEARSFPHSCKRSGPQAVATVQEALAPDLPASAAHSCGAGRRSSQPNATSLTAPPTNPPRNPPATPTACPAAG